MARTHSERASSNVLPQPHGRYGAVFWFVSLSVCAKKCIVGSFGVMYSFTVMTNSTSPPAQGFLMEKKCICAISCDASVCANPHSFMPDYCNARPRIAIFAQPG